MKYSKEINSSIDGYSCAQMSERITILLEYFGFKDISEKKASLDSVIDISLRSTENEISGNTITVFVKVSGSREKGPTNVVIILTSDNIDALQILAQQISDVIGVPLCPDCQSTLSYETELRYLKYGETKCNRCGSILQKLDYD